MNVIHSYPKVYNLGHPAIATLLDTPVLVQEKVDGSQISFMWDEDGQLYVKSKGSIQYGPERIEPDDMFAKAVEYLLGLGASVGVHDPAGLVFRAEWFSKPKHNTIAYDRTPKNGLMLFDVELAPNMFATWESIIGWADVLDIEAVPKLGFFENPAVLTRSDIEDFLDRESVLGGHKIEGVVIKAYDQYTRDAKVMMGKYVSEAFKEKHKREWKGKNPTNQDIVWSIIDSLNTEARWHKAVQHLRDEGLLETSPRDIGPLMVELKRDTEEEEAEWIAGKLMAHFMPQIRKSIGRGFPEWYKEQLMERQFDE